MHNLNLINYLSKPEQSTANNDDYLPVSSIFHNLYCMFIHQLRHYHEELELNSSSGSLLFLTFFIKLILHAKLRIYGSIYYSPVTGLNLCKTESHVPNLPDQ